MTTFPIRFFDSDNELERLGEGLVACCLVREDWTHEAHLGATAYLLRHRTDIDLDAELPGLIRGFNESVGGVNSDSEGYHDTITKAFLAGVRAFLAKRPPDEKLVDGVNAMLAAPEGRRDWPLRFYSKERLFSVEARRGFVAPDLSELP